MPGWLSDRINDWHLYEFFAYCIQITLYPAVKVLFIRLADALHPPSPDHQSKRISVSKPYVSVQQSNDHPAAQQRGLPCSIIIQEQREAIFPSGNGAAKSGVGVEGGERLHNGQRRRRRRNVTGSDRLHQHIAPPRRLRFTRRSTGGVISGDTISKQGKKSLLWCW